MSDNYSQQQNIPQTNDLTELRQIQKQLNKEIYEKKQNIQELNDKINQFKQTHEVITQKKIF